MKNVVLTLGVCAGFVLVASSWWSRSEAAYGQGATANIADSQGIVTLTSPVDDRRQQLTVIDPRMRVIGIYHVDLDTGGIALKSVRNFRWDLEMVEFNTANPLPREIRSMLQQN